MKNRLKLQPLATRGEFIETINELAALELRRREIEVAREKALQAVNREFDTRLAPIAERIKGKFALAEDYAEAHRDELLPDKAKSAVVALARYGWRTGNRTVALLARVTSAQAIESLKRLGLGAYVRVKEEIARDLILADCADGKTLSVAAADSDAAKLVPLGEAGLKIAQSETFFIEPHGERADTLTEAAVSAG